MPYMSIADFEGGSVGQGLIVATPAQTPILRPMANLDEYRMKLPSGGEVFVTPEEEKMIAKEVLVDQIRYDMTSKDRLKRTAVESGIGAVGNAVGFALGGYLLGRVLGIGGRPR